MSLQKLNVIKFAAGLFVLAAATIVGCSKGGRPNIVDSNGNKMTVAQYITKKECQGVYKTDPTAISRAAAALINGNGDKPAMAGYVVRTHLKSDSAALDGVTPDDNVIYKDLARVSGAGQYEEGSADFVNVAFACDALKGTYTGPGAQGTGISGTLKPFKTNEVEIVGGIDENKVETNVKIELRDVPSSDNHTYANSIYKDETKKGVFAFKITLVQNPNGAKPRTIVFWQSVVNANEKLVKIDANVLSKSAEMLKSVKGDQDQNYQSLAGAIPTAIVGADKKKVTLTTSAEVDKVNIDALIAARDAFGQQPVVPPTPQPDVQTPPPAVATPQTSPPTQTEEKKSDAAAVDAAATKAAADEAAAKAVAEKAAADSAAAENPPAPQARADKAEVSPKPVSEENPAVTLPPATPTPQVDSTDADVAACKNQIDLLTKNKWATVATEFTDYKAAASGATLSMADAIALLGDSAAMFEDFGISYTFDSSAKLLNYSSQIAAEGVAKPLAFAILSTEDGACVIGTNATTPVVALRETPELAVKIKIPADAKLDGKTLVLKIEATKRNAVMSGTMTLTSGQIEMVSKAKGLVSPDVPTPAAATPSAATPPAAAPVAKPEDAPPASATVDKATQIQQAKAAYLAQAKVAADATAAAEEMADGTDKDAAIAKSKAEHAILDGLKAELQKLQTTT